MLFLNRSGKEGTVYQRIDDAPDNPGDTPVAPLRRARLLTLTPIQVALGVESYDEGPMRLIRHERVAEDGHQRGR
jgi:hypothetical protein